jgi:2-phospho-L-lactate guanylyltransferase
MPAVSDAPPTVVVPVKRFADAKERLAPALTPDQRELLARRLAEGVVGAARGLDVVVCCDDSTVREWAESRGHSIAWTPGRDLNGSVSDAVAKLSARGNALALVAHADLPFPATLVDVAGRAGSGVAVIVADRHRDGTNVLAVPTGVGWRFGYGPGSFARHVAEARRLGLRAVIVDDDALAWDVDVPTDLDPPPALGRPTWDRSDA